MANQTLPPTAFDGQIFIDAFRVKWRFDGKARCWKRVGTVSDIPSASELQPGLLTSRLKQLIDSVPEGAGHFGIISRPLLSLNQNPNLLLKDTVDVIKRTESGTKIKGKSVCDRFYSTDIYAGRTLFFKTGTLANKSFLIFTNDGEFIFVEGDMTAAKAGDKFCIGDPEELNPSGVLLGDIELVSESLDITCIDDLGDPLPENCNLDVIKCDSVDNPPALNFEINDNFLDSLCITIPGCKGPRGDRGATGETGADGTGDGPQGEQGDAGADAPSVQNTFTGVKIVDVDDIYDTAIVAIDLDAANGKLTLVKAKVRTPDDVQPATRLVTTPLNRAINFTSDDSFNYEIIMPSADPIGTADVDILKYPDKFNNPGERTNVSKVKLSTFVDKLIEFWENKLSDVNDQYNQDIKTFIESKDAQARTILADLAHQVALCEFELPIEFCLGPVPNECKPTWNKETFVFPFAEELIGTAASGGVATDLGTISVTGRLTDEENGTVPPSTIQDELNDSYLQYPDQQSNLAQRNLPAGQYIITHQSGCIKDEDGYKVGDSREGRGVEFLAKDAMTDATTVHAFPALDPATVNMREASSVEAGYQNADVMTRSMAIDLPNGGTISGRALVTAPDGVTRSAASLAAAANSVTFGIIQIQAV